MNPFRAMWRRTLSLLNPKGWGSPGGLVLAGSKAGQAVTPESSLTVSAFWAAVRLASQTVGSLPLGFYERKSDGKRIERNDYDLAYILQESPNADNTRPEFWEAVVGCLCLRGVFYARIVRNVVGRISSLEIMYPDAVVARREGGRWVYHWVDPDGRRFVLPESEVFVINGWGLGCGGLSPLRHQANVLGIALAADEQAATMFASGMSTSGFLEVDAELDDAQRKQWQKNLEEFRGSGQAGRMMVLEAGVKYSPISLRPDESQLLLSRQFSVEEACRVVGVPPILVGHSGQGQTMWGSGIEQIILGWLMLDLRPRLVRIEHAIKKRLMTPVERLKFYPEFAVEGILRADSAGRASLYSTFVQNGIMTRNEARRLENLPPVEGGDELTVQVNLVPLAQLGQSPPQSEQVRSALLSWLGTSENAPPPETRPI